MTRGVNRDAAVHSRQAIPLVKWVIAERREPVSQAVEQVLEVLLVAPIVEAPASIHQTVGFIIALWLKDIARLEEDLGRDGFNKSPTSTEIKL